VHLTWKPETIARSGDDIDYQVQLDDGGPPFGISLGKFAYDPLLARLWRDNQTAIIGGLSALALLLIYAGYFAGVLFVAPARLGSIGGAPGLDTDVKLEGWVALVWKLGRSVLETVTLPSLSRHPRVRHAWTALYRDGNAKFDDLGKAARSSFVVLVGYSNPNVPMVKPTQDWQGQDASCARDVTRNRGVVLQRCVRLSL